MEKPSPNAPLGVSDYPLAEKRPDLVRTATGKRLDDLTVAAVAAGEVTLADVAVTPRTLRHQADIARAAGRPALALNFERAAEMVAVPQERILAIYELLRPGRAPGKAALLEAAAGLRRDFGAEGLAAFIEEAADVYEQRGLFVGRF